MKIGESTLTILMADDDDEACMLTQEAFEASRVTNPLVFVHDGEELMSYLRHEAPYESVSRPGLILLDLSMPRKSGREALAEIKSDPNLKTIPVIVLTTSRSEYDIHNCYELGASSFITKPVSFQSMVEAMKVLGHYWLEIVEIPDNEYGS